MGKSRKETIQRQNSMATKTKSTELNNKTAKAHNIRTHMMIHKSINLNVHFRLIRTLDNRGLTVD